MRALARIILVALLFGGSISVWAQDTPTGEPPKEAEKKEDGDAKPTSDEKVDTPPDLAALDVTDPNDLSQYDKAIADRMERWQALEGDVQTFGQDRTKRLGARDALITQLDLKLPKPMLKRVSRSVVEAELDIAMFDARLEVARIEGEQFQKEIDILTVRKAEAEDRVENESLDQAKAEEAEEDAMQALEKARQAESAATTEAMKTLATKERTLAERLVEIAKVRRTTLATTKDEIEEGLTVLNETETSLSTQRDAAASEANAEKRRRALDPVFRELVIERRNSRVARDQQRQVVRDAIKKLDELDAARAEAQQKLNDERLRVREKKTPLNDQRLKVAELTQKVAEQEYELQGEFVEAQTSYLAGLRSHIDVTTDDVEKSIPLISDQARSEYFRIDEQNLLDATESFLEGIEFFFDRAWDRFEGRTFWEWALDSALWIGSLFLRLLLVIIALRFFVLPLTPRVTESFSKFLFRRRFFAMRPEVSIRLTEILRAVIRPIVWYIAARWIFGFFADTIEELRVLVWVIDAIFAYRFVIRILEVLFLPRWYRQQQGSTSVDENDELRFRSQRRFGPRRDVDRGLKALKGARPVWGLFLFAIYFPDFVELVFGITMISNFVGWIVWFPFIFVAYFIISQWKDELATLFYDIANERLPKAATFVRDKKDKWYGVLLIVFAAVYVLFNEIQKIGRKYLLSTEFAQRASNFAFRKQIELRTQNEDADQQSNGQLPDEFREKFDIAPLAVDDIFFVDDGVSLVGLQESFERWGTERRQGSVALLGESGTGKTTLLNHFVDRFTGWGFDVVFRTVSEKRRRTSDVVTFVSELFEIEPSEDIDTVIRRVQASEPRIIVLDDCHHFFMRQIGGFDGLETLLDIVNLTDEKHFYVLSFNSFAWSYVNRVSPRSPYFGSVRTVGPWTVEKLQEIIEKRCNSTRFTPSFSDLVVTHEGAESADYFVEVVKSSQGYFRYLQEFSRGNPSVALTYWLKSLRLAENDVLRVSLFQRPQTADIEAMSDGHWFVLTAIAQHGELRSREIAQIVNLEPSFCALAVNFFEEMDVVEENHITGRVRLTPVFFRQVLRRLANQNFLYG